MNINMHMNENNDGRVYKNLITKFAEVVNATTIYFGK